MRQQITVSAKHPADAYRLDRQIVTVSQGGDGLWSASRAGFGYVCGFASKEAAIRDLLAANGCTSITIEGN